MSNAKKPTAPVTPAVTAPIVHARGGQSLRVAHGNSIMLPNGDIRVGGQLITPSEVAGINPDNVKEFLRDSKVVWSDVGEEPRRVGDVPGAEIKPLPTPKDGEAVSLGAGKELDFGTKTTQTGEMVQEAVRMSKGKWEIDPQNLTGKSLADLNAIAQNIEPGRQAFDTTEEAVAVMTQHFQGLKA